MLEVVGVVFMVVGLALVVANFPEESTPIVVGTWLGLVGFALFVVGLLP
jgi:hypothetical protein